MAQDYKALVSKVIHSDDPNLLLTHATLYFDPCSEYADVADWSARLKRQGTKHSFVELTFAAKRTERSEVAYAIFVQNDDISRETAAKVSYKASTPFENYEPKLGWGY